MTRFPDWATRLESYLRANAKREFRYGEWDCCLFTCGAIEAMTGVDPASEFRGLYDSHEAGLALLTEAGGIPGVAAAHGMPGIEIARAGRGDLVMLEWHLLGIVALNGRQALVIGDAGLQLVSLDLCQRAWRV